MGGLHDSVDARIGSRDVRIAVVDMSKKYALEA